MLPVGSAVEYFLPCLLTMAYFENPARDLSVMESRLVAQTKKWPLIEGPSVCGIGRIPGVADQ
jgi:hypothetical protein